MEKEFLLWSPGVLRSCGTHVLVLACAIALGAQSVELTERAQTLFDAAAHTLLWRARGLGLWSALGLLGSSCCAIQVVLHLFSFGCAGFNSVLGPLRAPFVALTLVVQAALWSFLLTRPAWQRKPGDARLPCQPGKQL